MRLFIAILVVISCVAFISSPGRASSVLVSSDKPVTASSEYTDSGSYAYLLTDDDTNTYWNSGGRGPAWAQIDLEAIVLISKVVWYANVSPSTDQTYDLYFDDTFITSTTEYITVNTPQQIIFEFQTPVEAQYVKMVVDSPVSWIAGGEFEIYTPGDDPIPSPVPEPATIILLLIGLLRLIKRK